MDKNMYRLCPKCGLLNPKIFKLCMNKDCQCPLDDAKLFAVDPLPKRDDYYPISVQKHSDHFDEFIVEDFYNRFNRFIYKMKGEEK